MHRRLEVFANHRPHPLHIRHRQHLDFPRHRRRGGHALCCLGSPDRGHAALPAHALHRQHPAPVGRKCGRQCPGDPVRPEGHRLHVRDVRRVSLCLPRDVGQHRDAKLHERRGGQQERQRLDSLRRLLLLAGGILHHEVLCLCPQGQLRLHLLHERHPDPHLRHPLGRRRTAGPAGGRLGSSQRGKQRSHRPDLPPRADRREVRLRQRHEGGHCQERDAQGRLRHRNVQSGDSGLERRPHPEELLPDAGRRDRGDGRLGPHQRGTDLHDAPPDPAGHGENRNRV